MDAPESAADDEDASAAVAHDEGGANGTTTSAGDGGDCVDGGENVYTFVDSGAANGAAAAAAATEEMTREGRGSGNERGGAGRASLPPSSSASSPPSPDAIVVGATVLISNLRTRADLNGARGTVISRTADGKRWVVRLSGTIKAEPVALTPRTMSVIPQEAPAPPFSQPSSVAPTAGRAAAVLPEDVDPATRAVMEEILAEFEADDIFNVDGDIGTPDAGVGVGLRTAGAAAAAASKMPYGEAPAFPASTDEVPDTVGEPDDSTLPAYSPPDAAPTYYSDYSKAASAAAAAPAAAPISPPTSPVRGAASYASASSTDAASVAAKKAFQDRVRAYAMSLFLSRTTALHTRARAPTLLALVLISCSRTRTLPL